MTETIKVETNTKNKFDKLQLDLRIKEKKRRTQSELLDMLINCFKKSYNDTK